MQQYPITTFTKYSDNFYQYSTRYTPNKFTDWHKKYEPKHKLDCQLDIKFQTQSILNQNYFKNTKNRQSQTNIPKSDINQFHSFNQEIKSPLKNNYDFDNYIRRVKTRLNLKI
ncbi:unnamed protein product [Paramecium sonneborni]|uniref:Uncharacterized protein n=1 Tax=Paramecium sonneborni TaxID=65129 RepID=A0A8S1RAR3_9CILI|nr:unnamed protein product [Paramecium sonneborni]